MTCVCEGGEILRHHGENGPNIGSVLDYKKRENAHSAWPHSGMDNLSKETQVRKRVADSRVAANFKFIGFE